MRKRRYTREADRLLPLILRRTGPIGGTVVGSAASDVTPAHGDLRGLTADDHLQYVHTAQPRTITATHNFTGLTGFTSPDADSVSYIGRAAVGSMGIGDLAGFAHRAMATPGNYALIQDRSGSTALNSPLGIYHRIANQDVLVMDNSSLKISGVNRATLQTDNYASQVTGWGGTYDGAWDVRYLFTDQLHAKVFVADLERALAGIEIIAKSVTLLGADFVLPYAGASTRITVRDLPSAAGMQVFEPGDYINPPTFSRAGGAFTIGDCWGTVSAPINNGDGTQDWTFTRSGTTTYNTIGRRASLSPTATNGPALSVNRPTNTANGDFLVAYIFTASSVLAAPAGWSLLGVAGVVGGTLYVYSKFAASEPTNWVWTFSASGPCAADCHGWTNVNSIRPIDKFVFGTNGNNTSLASYGIDPSSAAGMLILLGGIPANIRATPPAGMTEGTDFGTTGAAVYMAFQLLANDSATGTVAATLASASVSTVCLMVLAPTYSAMSSTAGAVLPMTTLLADKGQNAAVLDYGVSGNGWIEHNAIDGLYAVNAPYMQIVTWTGHPLTGRAVRMRQGNLKGLGVNDFGQMMGSNVANAATTTFDFRSSTGDLSLGTNDNIVLQGNGNSYFGGVMTIGTSGEIRQGSGSATFSPGSGNFTGLRIWNQSGVGLIGGYNAGAQQWYANTDGILYAGAGETYLDANGMGINAEFWSVSYPSAPAANKSVRWVGNVGVTAKISGDYVGGGGGSNLFGAIQFQAYKLTSAGALSATTAMRLEALNNRLYVDTDVYVTGAIRSQTVISTGTTLPLELITSSSGPYSLALTRSDIPYATRLFNDGVGMYFEHRPSIPDTLRFRSVRTPASAAAAGAAGDFCYDGSYFYICTATNTWQRVAHATW